MGSKASFWLWQEGLSAGCLDALPGKDHKADGAVSKTVFRSNIILKEPIKSWECGGDVGGVKRGCKMGKYMININAKGKLYGMGGAERT